MRPDPCPTCGATWGDRQAADCDGPRATEGEQPVTDRGEEDGA